MSTVTTTVADEVVEARAPWGRVVKAGETLRIIDLEGNQAVDCLLYDAHDTSHRYSAADTIVAQRNIFLVPGTVLRSNEGEAMMTITGSTCAYHDTIGGGWSSASKNLGLRQPTAHATACG